MLWLVLVSERLHLCGMGWSTKKLEGYSSVCGVLFSDLIGVQCCMWKRLGAAMSWLYVFLLLSNSDQALEWTPDNTGWMVG